MRTIHLISLIPLFAACVDGSLDNEDTDCTPDTNCVTDPETDPEPEPEPEPEPATALSFGNVTLVDEVESMAAIAHGDVDGDGFVDLVHAFGDSLVWLRGDGTGALTQDTAGWTTELIPALIDTFAATGQTTLAEDTAVEFIQGVWLADFNADGKDDLLLALTLIDEAGEYWTMVGSADLNASVIQPELLSFDDNYVSAEIIADLDDDGGAEVLLYTWHDSFLARNGTNPEPFSESVAGNYYPQSWTSDLNNDGRLDVLTFFNGGYGVMGITAFLRTEDGGFTSVVVDTDTFGYTAIGNGDHRAPATEIFLSTSEELFWIAGGELPALQDTESFEGFHPWATVFGDFNGSGALDFISRNQEGQDALKGDAQGGFEAIAVTGLQLENEEVAVDFTNDGLDDLYRVRWDGDSQSAHLEVILNTSR
jgi:hypothetical protein